MMVIFDKKTILIGCLYISSSLNAGTMGDIPSFSGLWAGVGGGYINTTTNGKTNITMVSSTTSPAEYLLNNNQDNHFAPIANAGYFYDLKNQWYIGAKGVYKYIGSEQFDQSWSGTFQNGAYQTAGLHTKLNQEFLLLMNTGYQFDHWLVYGGIGPSIINVSAELNGDVLQAGSITLQPVNITNNKTIWGGAGQVGFEYMLPNRFMIDISYNLLASGNTSIPAIYFETGIAGAYTSFSQQVQVIEQGVNISINKYFM